MPGRRGQKISESQQTSSSDDLMAAVAQKMQASWEKKNKEAENKFLENARGELNRCISSRAQEFGDATRKMDSIYERFVMENAAISDEIRKIFVALSEEQQTFLDVTKRQQQIVIEADQQRENGQVKGMAIAKRAVEDCGKLIQSLDPPY